MSKVYNNGISTTSGFQYNSDSPLDDRLVVELYDDLSSITKYDGMIVYVKNDDKYYKYTNNKWNLFDVDCSTKIAALEDKINAIASSGLTRIVVEELPDPSEAKENVIYMVPDYEKFELGKVNVLNEYMFFGNEEEYLFELIGSTATEFSGTSVKSLSFNTKNDLDHWLHDSVNILDLSKADTYTDENISNPAVYNNDGTFSILENYNVPYFATIFNEIYTIKQLTQGSTYVFSTNSGASLYVRKAYIDEETSEYVWSFDQKDMYRNGQTFTIDYENGKYVAYKFSLNAGGVEAGTYYAQLEEGTTPTEFVPLYVRNDGLTKNDLNIGDIIIIEEENTPNYYWDGAEIVKFESALSNGIGNGFKILACQEYTTPGIGLYTLSSINGISPGQIYYASLKNDDFNFGVVVQIVNENTIAVNNYRQIDLEDVQQDDIKNGKVFNYLTIVEHPELGDMKISYNATMLGNINQAIGETSFVAGKNNIAVGKQSTVFGDSNVAVEHAIASGYKTYALSSNSATFGLRTKTLGKEAIAEGTHTVAMGNNSLATGYGRNEVTLEAILQGALKDEDTAIGAWNQYGKTFNVAYGHNSNTSGMDNLAVGAQSTATGQQNLAKGDNSFVAGENNVANARNQFVAGQFNIIDDNALFIIGNGYYQTDTGATVRKNVFVVKKDGTVISNEKELATQEYVSSRISSLASSGITRTIVNNLPDSANAAENVIYMVPAENSSENNIYDEYMFFANTEGVLVPELIGNTAVEWAGTPAKSLVFNTNNELNSWLGLSNNLASVKQKDGVSINSDGTFNLNNVSDISVDFNCKLDTQYVFSTNNDNLKLRLWISAGEYLGQPGVSTYDIVISNGETICLDNHKDYGLFGVESVELISDTPITADNVYIQIEEGSNPTEFIPLNCIREDGLTKEDLNIGDIIIAENNHYYWDGSNVTTLNISNEILEYVFTAIGNELENIKNDIANMGSRVDLLTSSGLTRSIISKLPDSVNASENVIYMVPAENSSENNIYDEYMFFANTEGVLVPELIGNTGVNWTGSPTKSLVFDTNENLSAWLGLSNNLASVKQKDGVSINNDGTFNLNNVSDISVNFDCQEDTQYVFSTNNDNLKLEISVAISTDGIGVAVIDTIVSNGETVIMSNTNNYMHYSIQGARLISDTPITADNVYIQIEEGSNPTEFIPLVYIRDDGLTKEDLNAGDIIIANNAHYYWDGSNVSALNVPIESLEMAFGEVINEIDGIKNNIDIIAQHSPGFKNDEGGVILNDYEINKALKSGTVAMGVNTIAGSKAFNIFSVDVDNKSMTLDSVDGLTSKMLCSCQYNSNYDFFGEITEINNNNIVKFSALPADTFVEGQTNLLWIPSNPELGTQNIGTSASAEGYSTKAVQVASHAEGYNTIAGGKYSHVEGRDTKAAYASHAEGSGSEANGQEAHAEGSKNKANGFGSHAEGGHTTANGGYSHTEGFKTEANADFTHAEGQNSIADNKCAHAEGYQTLASGADSHAEGNQTQATGNYSHAEGVNSKAIGIASHAEGSNVIAEGDYSHAEGNGCRASGNMSRAMGNSSVANATSSIASGTGSSTSNVSDFSFVHGQNAKAGVVEGQQSKWCVAMGQDVQTDANNQIALGKFNNLSDRSNGQRPVFMIGYGTSDSVRKNNFAIFRNGVARVGAGPIDAMDVATKNYVDTSISNIELQDSGNKTLLFDTNANFHNWYYGKNLFGAQDFANDGENSVTREDDGTFTVFSAYGNSVSVGGVIFFESGIYTISASISDGLYYNDGNGNKVFITTNGIKYNAKKDEYLEFFSEIYTGYDKIVNLWLQVERGENCTSFTNTGISTYNRVDSFTKDDLNIGDLIIIEEENKPDYYWNGTDIVEIKTNVITQISSEACDIHNGTNANALYQLSEKSGDPELGFNFSHLISQNIEVPNGTHNRKSETGINAISLGTSLATGKRSFAAGSSNIAGGNGSTPANVAMGKDNYAKGDASFALGYANYSEGNYSMASGTQTQAIGVASHTEGINTKATKNYSHAEGASAVAGGIASHAEGNGTEAIGDHSHAEGELTKANYKNSHAGGLGTKTSATEQTVIGKYNAEDPNAIFIVGNGTGDSESQRNNVFVVKNDGTVIANDKELANKEQLSNYALKSAAVGKKIANGGEVFNRYEDVEYNGEIIKANEASGANSHAEGYVTIASGASAHSEGSETKAIANCAHAEGYKTTASGISSHAGGSGTIASSANQMAIGKYNAEDPNALFIIGNGTADNNRKNAFVVTNDGKVFVNGKEMISKDEVLTLINEAVAEALKNK